MLFNKRKKEERQVKKKVSNIKKKDAKQSKDKMSTKPKMSEEEMMKKYGRKTVANRMISKVHKSYIHTLFFLPHFFFNIIIFCCVYVCRTRRRSTLQITCRRSPILAREAQAAALVSGTCSPSSHPSVMPPPTTPTKQRRSSHLSPPHRKQKKIKSQK